ncbi:MAG TPA: right-handed parallel beta-helix repeat-containing protein [Candidatus Limnocylindrales bacterium]|nr:right-handed parallel beta-helix repeat-containing protein [Candidatus Limnocylindrales bacterium]
MGRVLLAALGALVLVVVGLVLGGFLGGGTEATYRVVRNLDDFYNPEIVRVEVGAEVEWENSGRNPHTVTADDGSFDSGVLETGDEFSHVFETEGVFRFTCLLHGRPGGIGMTGIVVVGDAVLPSTGGVGGVGPGREPVPEGPGATIRVPADAATIQGAVDAASPGDLILVAAGEYREAVLVTTPYLTIRGEDRNATILDGDFTLANGIHVVEADGVVVENLTARHYQLNGIYWAGVNGYRASYVTTYANGDYGVYAFDSVWGRFEHSYASGHPDSGFYIGQCQPCHAVITDVVSEHNGLGYSGTNAGGDLAIVNSEWRRNNAGIVPNTLDSELLAPQAGTVIAGNWVHGNSATDAPLKRLEYPAFGIGILVAGGRDNLVEENLVEGHAVFGIALLPNLDANLWATSGNVVRGNDVSGSGRADLAVGAPSVRGDCFEANRHATSLPPAIETLVACDARIAGGGDPAATVGLLARFAQALGGHYTSGDWRTEPAPPAQAKLPDALGAPPVPAVPETAVPGPYAIRSIEQIRAGAGGVPAVAREVTIMGIPLTSTLTTVLGLYGYVFPLVLYAAWVAIALWDLVRREPVSDRRRIGWMAVVLVVPVLGPVAYFVAGGSPISRPVRWFLVLGGLAIYLGIATLAFLAEAL